MDCQVFSFEVRDSSFCVHTSKGDFLGENLIIATGKGDINLERSYTAIGLKRTSVRTSIGVRLEIPKEGMDYMKAKSNNLKIKKHYENAYVKTHCVCYAGEVVPYRAQQMSLVGGRADSYALRDTSNVNILYRSARQNSLDAALNTLRKFEKVSNGNVVYQTIDDFLESNISDGLFIPNRDWEIKGDVSKLFDKTVYESLRDFLITVYEKKYIDIRHGLVHAPAAEWIVPQVSVNFNFETDVDGLFVVGDGSGKTQGILSAAVSALRATNVIRQRRNAA